jgi:hypothetical protein
MGHNVEDIRCLRLAVIGFALKSPNSGCAV